MKIIKIVKMPTEEKNLLTKWLEELFNLKLPCEGIKCSGIPWTVALLTRYAH